MILLDTDHLSVLADVRHARRDRLVERLLRADEPASIPIVAVEEQLRAWLAQIRRTAGVHKQLLPYDRLARLIDLLSDWTIVRWSEQAADEFTRLRALRVRIGTQDLKIAALSVVNDAMLLSANLRDFNRVPSLRVEDWLYNKHEEK